MPKQHSSRPRPVTHPYQRDRFGALVNKYVKLEVGSEPPALDAAYLRTFLRDLRPLCLPAFLGKHAKDVLNEIAAKSTRRRLEKGIPEDVCKARRAEFSTLTKEVSASLQFFWLSAHRSCFFVSKSRLVQSVLMAGRRGY